MKKLLLAAVMLVAAMVPAVASHGGERSIVKGVPAFVRSTLCIQEAHALSVLDKYREAGFAQSVELLETLLADGRCFNMPQPMYVMPVRLVAAFEDAVVVEVANGRGQTAYMVARTNWFESEEDRAKSLGDPA